jgi:hypothetical protein
MTANKAASVRARLKQHADARKQDFNLVLTRYGLERLLYRLSVSEHSPNFLLKGALLLQLWYGHAHRPTRDADLLGYGSATVEDMVAIFRTIVAVPCDDGIVFERDSVRGTEIREGANYGGVRLGLIATLDGARITLQVDIGFGDAVTPAPVPVQYPTLLANLAGPTLRAYPKATVAAEKLHAIAMLGMANSRMKDFFDLDVLLRDPELDDDQLGQAIDATFRRRQTDKPAVLPLGLSEQFATDAAKRAQWRAFVTRNSLAADDLGAVVGRIRARAAPLMNR